VSGLRKPLLAILLLGGFALLLFWQSQRNARGVEVDVAAVEQGVLADTALASGNLVFAEQIQLRSEVTGRVAEVLVEEGQQVRRGELLLRLDPEAFEADLESTAAGVRAAEIEIESRRARLRDVERRLQRQRELHARGLVGQEAFEQLSSERDIATIAVRAAEQTLRQQQAQRELARDRLGRSLFRAPIDGLVVSAEVKPGETVIAGSTNIVGSDLMVLADPGVLLAELRVDEADIARVALGQAVEVFAAAYPNIALPGRVVHIGSSARQLGSAQGLAFRVRVQLEAQDLSLHPGMSCRAEIVTAQADSSLNVPVAAVQRDGQGQYVWRVAADARAERVAVTLGMANDFSQAVLSGLDADDRVVIGPGRVLGQLAAGARLQFAELGQ
jgi:HlyD family secretion protein